MPTLPLLVMVFLVVRVLPAAALRVVIGGARVLLAAAALMFARWLSARAARAVLPTEPEDALDQRLLFRRLWHRVLGHSLWDHNRSALGATGALARHGRGVGIHLSRDGRLAGI